MHARHRERARVVRHPRDGRDREEREREDDELASHLEWDSTSVSSHCNLLRYELMSSVESGGHVLVTVTFERTFSPPSSLISFLRLLVGY